MTEPTDNKVTTSQLLEFLVKVHKVASFMNVEKRDNGYVLTVHCDWYNEGRSHPKTTFITEEMMYTWDCNWDYGFITMDSALSDLVKQKDERAVREQKRQALLSRLTKEEKELLGVK